MKYADSWKELVAQVNVASFFESKMIRLIFIHNSFRKSYQYYNDLDAGVENDYSSKKNLLWNYNEFGR